MYFYLHIWLEQRFTLPAQHAEFREDHYFPCAASHFPSSDFWNSSFQDRPSSDVERDAEILDLFKGELNFSFLDLILY